MKLLEQSACETLAPRWCPNLQRASQKAQQSARVDSTVRLLSYNIHKGVGGTDRRYRLQRIIDVICAEQPDLVCLQEVDFNVKRSRFDNQPDILADKLQANASCYQLNHPYRDGGYGNLILSRWPLRH